jgi:hypothetical protein
MKVFLAREHVVDEGSSILGIFSTLEAAIACLNKLEPQFSCLEDGELNEKIVYNRTYGCCSLQVVVYTVQE